MDECQPDGSHPRRNTYSALPSEFNAAQNMNICLKIFIFFLGGGFFMNYCNTLQQIREMNVTIIYLFIISG